MKEYNQDKTDELKKICEVIVSKDILALCKLLNIRPTRHIISDENFQERLRIQAWDQVKNLLNEESADPNIILGNGDTLLLMAVKRGSIDLVNVLLNAGAIIDQKNSNDYLKAAIGTQNATLLNLINDHIRKQQKEEVPTTEVLPDIDKIKKSLSNSSLKQEELTKIIKFLEEKEKEQKRNPLSSKGNANFGNILNYLETLSAEKQNKRRPSMLNKLREIMGKTSKTSKKN